MELKNTFIEAKMNKDSDERLIPNGQLVHAENVRIVSPDGSNSGSAKTTLGNTEVNSSLSPASTTVTLGSAVDNFSDKIYYASYDSFGTGLANIIEYDAVSDTTTTVLFDNRIGDANVLNFSTVSYIDMDVLNDVENGRKFLFMSDGVNEPRMFDIEYAKSIIGATFTEEQINLIRNTPLSAPTLTPGTLASTQNSSLEDKLFIFSYRYKYRYNEYSAFAPYSETAFWAGNFINTNFIGRSMTNIYSDVDITFNTGGSEVTDIDIIARELGTSNDLLVQSYNKDDQSWADNSNQTINFDNSSINSVLPEDQSLRFSDNVPLAPVAQTILSNRVLYGNYKEGYDMVNVNGDIIPFFSLDEDVTTGLTENQPYRSVKTGVDYEVAIAYLDGKGRITTPFTSIGGSTANIPNFRADDQNKLRVTINNEAPDFATHFRFFLRQSRTGYYIISSDTFIVSGDDLWVLVNNLEDKLAGEDYLILKNTGSVNGGPSNLLTTTVRLEIVEVSQQSSNFLGGGEPAGTYVKLSGDVPTLNVGGANRILLETEGTNADSSTYYELPRTYPLLETGGIKYHQGNGGSDQNQTAVQSAIIILEDFYNCYAWANGWESNRLAEEFQGPEIKLEARPSAPIDNYRQISRIASLTYSGVYEATTGYNALNEFNLSTANFKDMDILYGSIQYLHSKDTNLYVFQEDKTHRVLYNKDVLFDADSQGNIRQSNNVLGQEVPYTGEYGICTNPESFAFYGNRIYHMDIRRGALMRLSTDGYTEISQSGMYEYFRDLSRTRPNESFVGQYDPYNDEYLINVQDTGTALTLAYSERVKGFTSFYSFAPDSMEYINNRLYSNKQGKLYVHDDTVINRNNFYGTDNDSKISVIMNDDPSNVKIFKTVTLEGTQAWDTTLKAYISDQNEFKQSTVLDTEYVEKEGKWYSYVRRNELDEKSSKSTYGLGTVTSFGATTLSINGFNSSLCVGDEIFNESDVRVGEVTGNITVTGQSTSMSLDAVTGVTVGTYVYGKKTGRIEGSEMRGYSMLVELQTDNKTNIELYSIASEVSDSYR